MGDAACYVDQVPGQARLGKECSLPPLSGKSSQCDHSRDTAVSRRSDKCSDGWNYFMGENEGSERWYTFKACGWYLAKYSLCGETSRLE